jgi:hypothetical protein
MAKYFYLFGGVIIGAFVSYFYLKKIEFDSINYEDIDDDIKHIHNVTEQIMTGQSIPGQSMTGQSIPEQSMTEQIFQCEPQIIKLKSS